jgi:hypothetical protein
LRAEDSSPCRWIVGKASGENPNSFQNFQEKMKRGYDRSTSRFKALRTTFEVQGARSRREAGAQFLLTIIDENHRMPLLDMPNGKSSPHAPRHDG